MTTEYEHGGVTYHEPLPRVLLANFSASFTHQLMLRSHNVSGCDVSKLQEGRFRTLVSPRPPYEVDVLLVRDHRDPLSPPELNVLSNVLGISLAPDHGPNFTNDIRLPGGGAESLGAFYTTITNRNGVCVFFLSEREAALFTGFEVRSEGV